MIEYLKDDGSFFKLPFRVYDQHEDCFMKNEVAIVLTLGGKAVLKRYHKDYALNELNKQTIVTELKNKWAAEHGLELMNKLISELTLIPAPGEQ
jgi:hypothetical protein